MKNPFFLIFFIFLVFDSPLIHAFTPDEVIAKFSVVVSSITDYQCRIAEWSVNGRRRETRIINFYFKKPRYMRMDIILGNRLGDTGASSVYRPDGTILGRMGWMNFSLKVPVNHWSVTTVRGKSFEQSDLRGMQELLMSYRDVSEMSVVEEGAYIRLLVKHYDTRVSGGLTDESIIFDRDTMLPLQVDGYDGNKQVQHFVFTRYIVDSGLPLAVFDPGFDPSELSSLGIESIALIPVGEDDLAESRF